MINQITSRWSTKISEAINLAFQQLNNRKYKNNVSSIFLLSDGHDPNAATEVEQQIGIVNDPFTLHTFGFGDGHDAQLMTSICNLKNGSFYFVQDITLLDEFFVDALGGLISVIGEEVQIQVTSNPDKPFQGIKISKTYGKMWRQINESYEINFPQLISGTRKDFVFEIAIPKFINDVHNQNIKIIDAKISIRNPLNGEIIQKFANLYLNFYNPDQEVVSIEEDSDVQTQYFRVKGTEAIDEARKACEQNKFEDAQSRINHILLLEKQIQYNLIISQFKLSNFQFIYYLCNTNLIKLEMWLLMCCNYLRFRLGKISIFGYLLQDIWIKVIVLNGHKQLSLRRNQLNFLCEWIIIIVKTASSFFKSNSINYDEQSLKSKIKIALLKNIYILYYLIYYKEQLLKIIFQIAFQEKYDLDEKFFSNKILLSSLKGFVKNFVYLQVQMLLRL